MIPTGNLATGSRIFGVGTDLCEVARIEAAWARFGEAFAARILGAQELALFHRRHTRHARRGMLFLSTRFAAKEALSKALGLGMRSPMSWRVAELLPQPSGQPAFHLHAPLAAWCAERHLHLHASVTDTETLVQAFVVAEVRAP